MELKEFIEQSIGQIVDAVISSQQSLAEKGAIVCPSGIKEFTDGVRLYKVDTPTNKYNGIKIVDSINFEVNVTTTATDGKGFSLEVGIVGLGISGNTNKQKMGGETAKLSFSIPIIFPQHPDQQ